MILLTTLILAIQACSGSSGSTSPDTTSATIALTDAAIDEVDVFEVDVKNVVLTKLDDSTVSVLTKAARIDFAALETVSEMLVGAAIPVGTYKRISMVLDFSEARVCLTGQTSAASVLDAVGNAITGEVRVDVTFAANARPNAVVSRNNVFLFDLDLNQALSVDLTNNRVTFTPVATAEFNPLIPKPVFATGILQSVSGSVLSVERRTPSGDAIGTYEVLTNTATVFQIDGENYIGSAGITALDGLPADSRIFVQGTLSGTFQRLVAVAVETGKGTRGNGQDWVIGHIVGRDNGAGSNATLTVLGRSLDTSSAVRRINTSHTVTVDVTNTKVLKRLSNSGLTTDNLSVGQRVIAFGTLTGTALDATSDGVVRMRKTAVWGTANAQPTGEVMTLNVTRFGIRPIGAFNFTVGGTSQATPTAFTVDVESLSTTGVSTGSKIRAFGFLNPVDVSTDEDFKAESFTNRSSTGSLLVVQWAGGTTSPFSTQSSTMATLDVANAMIKVVGDGFGKTTLANNPTPAKISTLANLGIFRIVDGGEVELHVGFDTFLTALASRIGGNNQTSVFRISALGLFNQTTQTMTATVVSAVLL